MTSRYLVFACPACTGGHFQAARHHPDDEAPETVLRVGGARWLRLFDAYRRARARTQTFVTHEKKHAVDALNAARRAVRAALEDLFVECVAPVLPDETFEGRFYTSRCAELLAFPVINCFASVRDAWGWLPLDLHPRIPPERVRAIARREDWICPRMDQLLVLVGADLGEGAIVDPNPSVALPDAVVRDDVAAVIRWAADRDVAFERVRAAGGVVMALTPDNFFDAVSGVFDRPYLQIIAHLPEMGSVIQCDGDHPVDLVGLRDGIFAGSTAATTRLASVDLVGCYTAGTLSEIFHRLGVDFVRSMQDKVHVGRMSADLRTMYTCGLIDGRTPFQHAWLRAASARRPLPG